MNTHIFNARHIENSRMLNVELAVLQTLDHTDWWTLSQISARTQLQEQTAAEALQELNQNGIVETRTVDASNDAQLSSTEWRSMDDSLSNYLEGKIPF